ncbi:MAG: hypothetical protein L3J97_05275 [Thermoplasmata archaeon]|nr:hypothetical protein [Thermoplasmata archaeon]
MNRRVAIAAGMAALMVGGSILFVAFVLLPRLAPPSNVCNCPTGTTLEVGTPVGTTYGWAHWYNATVASTGVGVTLGDTSWQLQSATGSIIAPGPNWTIEVLDGTGTVVGVYNPITDIWAYGVATPWTSLMMVSIYSSNSSLSGDHLDISLTGSFTGSESVVIP